MAAGRPDHPQTKVSGTSRPPGQGPHPDPEVRFGYALKQAPAYTQKHGGVHLRELRVTEVDGGWRVMVKGDRGKEPVVCYTYHESYVAALVLAMSFLDQGQVTWHHDRYPPQRYASPPIPLRF